jgi:hypothetical protein
MISHRFFGRPGKSLPDVMDVEGYHAMPDEMAKWNETH